jgi:hypothetical protein
LAEVESVRSLRASDQTDSTSSCSAETVSAGPTQPNVAAATTLLMSAQGIERIVLVATHDVVGTARGRVRGHYRGFRRIGQDLLILRLSTPGGAILTRNAIARAGKTVSGHRERHGGAQPVAVASCATV